jgi:hypothetical protein
MLGIFRAALLTAPLALPAAALAQQAPGGTESQGTQYNAPGGSTDTGNNPNPGEMDQNRGINPDVNKQGGTDQDNLGQPGGTKGAAPGSDEQLNKPGDTGQGNTDDTSKPVQPQQQPQQQQQQGSPSPGTQ